MTSRFSADVTVDAGSNTDAIFKSIEADGRFHPGGPTTIQATLEGGAVLIRVESDHIPHLRAGLNSTLRLVQASHDAIQAVGI